MTVKQLINYGKKYINQTEIELILQKLIGCNHEDIYSNLDKKLDEEKTNDFKSSVDLVKNGYPVQYITNNAYFYGMEFYVDKNVLIPRYDTEQLVFYVSKFIDKEFNGKAKLLDIGCGSGIISVTLSKKFPELQVTALDVSESAINITKKNAVNNNVLIKTILSNLFDKVDEKYDIIVSNPPYISLNESIDDSVRKYEPHIALFADEDGLYFYKAILKKANKYLNKKFLIAFEIGYNQKKAVLELINTYMKNVNINVYKDLAGRDRVIIIYNKNE